MAKAMKIRKDDTRPGHRRQGPRQDRPGAAHRAAKQRVYVEGINMVKRHQRPRSVKDTQKSAQAGGIIEKEGPIHVSNVMLLDPSDNKPTRVGVRVKDGKRERYAKRTGNRDRLERRAMEATVTEPSSPPRPPRLRERYEGEIAERLIERFAYSTAWRSRGSRRSAEHGHWRRQADHPGPRGRDRAARRDLGPASERAPCPQVDRQLQGPRGDAGGRGGDAARRPDVGVRRPARVDRDPAHPRFPRAEPRSFDGRGNYSLGIREQLIFPEIDYDSIDEVRGLNVTITTSAKTDQEAFELLLALGFPFSRRAGPGQVDHEAEEEERRREEARQRAEAEAGRAGAAQGGEPRGLRQARAAEEGEEGEEGAEVPSAEPRTKRRGRRADGRSETNEDYMAKTSQIVRQRRKPKYMSRGYNRCRRCGRPRAYYRKFGLCRLCLRELAHKGYIPGMTKSSW